jgi:hypothetical protein
MLARRFAESLILAADGEDAEVGSHRLTKKVGWVERLNGILRFEEVVL